MTLITVDIPTLNDNPDDFAKLFDICDQVTGHSLNIQFDFSNCNFLRPNAVAFIGGISKLIVQRQGSVKFDWDSLKNRAVLANLCQSGFAKCFGYPMVGWGGHSIPYREDCVLAPNAIMDYLTYYWLGRGWIHISDMLRDAITGRMWEIYANAFEHSGTGIGVITCGQHYKTQNELILSVVDFGKGIPCNVRNFFRAQGVDESSVSLVSDAGWLQWAFEKGNSTGSGSVARGLGLDLLKEFVRVNQGKLEIYSNSGYVIVNHAGEAYANKPQSFDGTIVHMTLRCDETLYRFRSESC